MEYGQPFNPTLNSHQIWDLVRVLEINITFEHGYVTVDNDKSPATSVDLPQAVVKAAVEKLQYTGALLESQIKAARRAC